ncbi:MAG: FecR family protein [Rhodothermales bacterium]
MKESNNKPHPDLDVVLGALPSEEADRLRHVWDLAGSQEPASTSGYADAEQAWQRLEAALPGTPSPSQTSRIGRLRAADREVRRPVGGRSRGVQAIAATLLGVLLLGAAGLFWWLSPVSQTAPLGERLSFLLPDGSRVELNSGSTLRYARRFGDVRAVDLEGEGFFDVAEAPRPFVVRTFNAQVRVLGTRFGVRAWPDGLEPSTTVALESGRVALASLEEPDQPVTMAPGETRRVAARPNSESGFSRLDLSVADATSWRQGDLFFKNQPLGVVLRDVERRFGVRLQVQPALVHEPEVSLALRQPPDAETVVRDLSIALGLRYRETSDGYTLYAP